MRCPLHASYRIICHDLERYSSHPPLVSHNMQVRPYPFTCFHVADADANVTPVRSKDTMDFLSKQKEPAVAGSRNVRRRVRYRSSEPTQRTSC